MSASVLAAAAVGIFLAGPLLVFERLFDGGKIEPVDFASLSPTSNPNWYLVAPQGLCRKAAVSREGPVFPFPASELDARVRRVALGEARVKLLAEDSALRQLELEARTLFWRFPDRITIRSLDLPGGGSSLAVFGRAVYGRSDLGVNRRRIERWLSALDEGA